MDHIEKPKTLMEQIAESKSLIDHNGQPKTLRDLWYPGNRVGFDQSKTLMNHNAKSKTLSECLAEFKSQHKIMDYWYSRNRDSFDQPSRNSFPANSFANRPQSINMFSEFKEIEDIYNYTRDSEKDILATSTRRIEALESQGHTQFNQVLAPICTGCDAPDHIVEECPFLMSPTQNKFTHGGAAYEKYLNEPYAPTYNLGWGNHPNSAWSQDTTFGAYNFNQSQPRPIQSPNDPNDQRLNTLQNDGIEALTKLTSDTSNTLNNVMQTMGQQLNVNTQAIARLEIQLNQLITMVNEQEEGGNQSQLKVDFRDQDGQEPQQEDQFDQFIYGEQMHSDIEIPENHEAENINEVSTFNDHRTQPSLEPLVEPLMTLTAPLSKQEEATKVTPEPLPQHLENTCSGPHSVTKSDLGPIPEIELLAIEEIKTPRSKQPTDIFDLENELDQSIDANSTQGSDYEPSIGGAPKLELKPLPITFRYAFLGPNDTIPVIIASDLTCDQEAQLIGALQEYKEAIKRTIADLKGIDPFLSIYCEPNDKTYKNLQRGPNLTMWEVDRNEITKMLDEDIIYPTSNSQEISPIQVELKEPCIITVRGISYIMVQYREYYATNSESRRELQTHVKIRAGIG